MSVLGAFLMADWQSIPYDPCTELSLFHHPELADNYIILGDTPAIAFSSITSTDVLSQQHGLRISEAVEFNVHMQALQIFEDSVHNVARNKCEEVSVSKHRSPWTPSSSVSKELCMDCQPICRSVDRTLNLAQFLIGAVLFEYSQPFSRVSFTAILSDYVRRDLQVRSG